MNLPTRLNLRQQLFDAGLHAEVFLGCLEGISFGSISLNQLLDLLNQGDVAGAACFIDIAL